MLAAQKRMIQRLGKPVTVRNATGGGGRTLPEYEADGEIAMIKERRGMPRTLTDSDGSETEVSIELRCVPDGADPELSPAGEGSQPTLLDHPEGTTYRLLDTHVEDGGVVVLSVVED
ncbi:hypothetical protein [Natronorarus salvus]|uniref:hypothetical protein n=1 Tax=Natronorarus salvus TaxID=3117733 RepID=UPI002F264D3E